MPGQHGLDAGVASLQPVAGTGQTTATAVTPAECPSASPAAPGVRPACCSKGSQSCCPASHLICCCHWSSACVEAACETGQLANRRSWSVWRRHGGADTAVSDASAAAVYASHQAGLCSTTSLQLTHCRVCVQCCDRSVSSGLRNLLNVQKLTDEHVSRPAEGGVGPLPQPLQQQEQQRWAGRQEPWQHWWHAQLQALHLCHPARCAFASQAAGTEFCSFA